MFGAAVTKGDVTVLNVIPKHLEATIAKLEEIGCEVEEFDDAVRVVSKGKLRHTQVKTLPYPGFPTDMQPQMGVALALCEGTSTITESILKTVLNIWMSLPGWELFPKLREILLPLKGWRNFPEPE